MSRRGAPLPAVALLLAAGAARAQPQVDAPAAPPPPVAPALEASPPPPDLDRPPRVVAVVVRGVAPDRERLLYDRLTVRAGEPLDEAAVEESRVRMLASGLCEAVEARLARGDAPGDVRVELRCTERKTFSIDALHLGHARPTDVWAGFAVSDLDPFNTGVALATDFVASADQGAGAVAASGASLFGGPGQVRVGLRAAFGHEPFVGPRGQALDGESVSQVRVRYRRLGADAELGLDTDVLTRLTFGLHGEHLLADRPTGATELDAQGDERPFDFDLRDGGSFAVSLDTTLAHDRRDDPVHPSRGLRAAATARVGTGDYAWMRVDAALEQYLRLPWSHVLRLDAQVGAILGDAPFFEQFFIGDLHPYLPDRVLGLNFARRRGPLILESALDEQRYEHTAGRVGLEYRIPLSRADDPYPLELFVSGAGLVLGRLTAYDVAFDAGLRLSSEIGVLGLSVGQSFLFIDP